MKFLILFIFILISLKSIWTLDKKKDCKCSDINARIINGKRASIFDYPWQIQIAKLTKKWPIFDYIRRKLTLNDYILRLHKCGGSIINELFVLTAAHCVFKKKIKELGVGYGYDDDIKIFTEDKFIKIENVFIHPEYNETSVTNDIALIELAKPIEFFKSRDSNAEPACLPKNSDYLEQYEGVLKTSGFGLISRPTINNKTGIDKNVVTTRYLQETDVYDMTNSVAMCEGRKKVNICVGNSKNETSCFGDSGGPLHEIENGKARVIGITSFGPHEEVDEGIDEYIACISYSAYTRLSTYMDFVRKHVGDNYCS